MTHTVSGLADMVAAERDPFERLSLIALIHEVMDQTLGVTTDRAIYDARRACATIDETVEVTGLKRWVVKSSIQRHVERTGDDPTNPHRQIQQYRPIM
ncbi:MAG: hypothetical protein ACOYB3_01825 [Azonexus sp.]